MSSFSSRSYALLTALLAGSGLLTSSLVAQETAAAAMVTAVAVEVASAPGAPLLAGASALGMGRPITWSPFVEVAPTSRDEVVAFQDRLGAGPNIALMAVGGAALVVGLVMDSDPGMIIATGGAVIFLVGLYRYLK